jgi:predicted RNA methylase
MPTTKIKKYAPPFWTKQALRYASNPEEVITQEVLRFRDDPASSTIAFDGTPLELLQQIYIEHRKNMKSVHLALFPTPMPVARRMAQLLGLTKGDIAFDPNAGLGNLLIAAQECGATAHGVEFQYWLPSLLKELGLNVVRGDITDMPASQIQPYTHVICNPPYGKICNHTDATAATLERVTLLSHSNLVTCAALLPYRYFDSTIKTRMKIADRIHIIHEEEIAPRTFAPLTNVGTTLYLFNIA